MVLVATILGSICLYVCFTKLGFLLMLVIFYRYTKSEIIRLILRFVTRSSATQLSMFTIRAAAVIWGGV